MKGERIGDRLSRLLHRSPRPEVDEELAYHLEMRARDYESRGLDAESARRAAVARLGDLSAVRAECTSLLASERRAAARRERLGISWLDLKLGVRMLRKHPAMTVIGGLSMAFAIWAGAGAFEFGRQMLHPALPLPGGERVVGIVLMDAESGGPDRRVAYDFGRWRETVGAVESLGAFRDGSVTLITSDGAGQPIDVARMTATGFSVAGVAPLLGRTLVAADEEAGADPVVVLGYDVWQRRFGGDPAVVGGTVRLGVDVATVVGVMPEGFAFPVAHGLWVPLGRTELEHGPREGPRLYVFGRLARGSSLAQAQAELEALGGIAAADHPETHERLRPRVLPYAKSIIFLPGPISLGLFSINALVVLFLVLICGNVALLMFARAAAREGELVVRAALGASRARIITQLFMETLVLGGIAAVIGLSAAGLGLRWLYGTVLAEVAGDRLPFWVLGRLSPATIVYALLLTLLAAAVAGVVPALKVTGRRVDGRLRQVSAGGGGLRFGGVWTAVIVCQVAVTVAAPIFALGVRHEAVEIRALEPGIAANEYLVARLEMDPEVRAGDDVTSRFSAAAVELERRLEARPGVAGVTFGERFPLMYHPHRLIEVDDGGAAPKHPDWPAYRVSSAAVALDYFAVLRVPIVAGRGFHEGDLDDAARTVLVNESFVEQVLGGRNPIGRHVQYAYFEEERDMRDPASEPWHRIVGVVPDLGISASSYDPKRAALYHPARPGGVHPVHIAIHGPGGPAAMAHVLHTHAADVDPALRVHNPLPLDRALDRSLRFYSFWLRLLVCFSVLAVTLALAGIYAVMAFTVSRRTREIGVRVALGAGRVRILAQVFRRPARQVGLGLVGGALFVTTLIWLMAGSAPSTTTLGMIAAYLLVMAAVCATACVVPARRALAVQPMEALRAE